jgi:hypothetical protein
MGSGPLWYRLTHHAPQPLVRAAVHPLAFRQIRGVSFGGGPLSRYAAQRAAAINRAWTRGRPIPRPRAAIPLAGAYRAITQETGMPLAGAETQAMEPFLYRFRTCEKLLDSKYQELERREIYFADPK